MNESTADYYRSDARAMPMPPTAPGAPPRRAQSAPRPKKQRGCLWAVVIGGALTIALSGVAMMVLFAAAIIGGGSMGAPRDWSISQTVLHDAADVDDRVAVVDIHGPILGGKSPKSVNPETIKTILQEVQRDERVKAIVLNMDTPGGAVLPSDEIYNAVARIDLPVVVCMRSVCASGGYYIAAAADYIVANEVTLTGSIGVIIPHYQYNGLLEKIGVKNTAIRSGMMKDMLSGGRERDPAEAAKVNAYVQQLVDETFRRFCIVVAEGRDKFLTWEDVKESPFGDGRVLLGRQALELGLVDECGYFENALAAAKRLALLEEADIIRYERALSLPELLFAKADTKVEITTGLESALPALEPTQIYYMMPNLME
ncbi:MAG: signal peptide peptidase SppA [Lentisphaeria bacterium]|nr:signal peptide peptidase SppA [Lentisphaeria bacterium]